jgi:hypothetical protein
MKPQSVEELEQVCKEICPACATLTPWRYRPETAEFVHETFGHKGAFAHSFCLASHYRTKYRDKVGG